MCCDLNEFEGLPASHAWRWKAAGLWRARLLTKAQCCGLVVSIVVRTDRGALQIQSLERFGTSEWFAVEFLVDDGTGLIKAVLWGDEIKAPVALGDLVHVEGKLNVDKNWDALESSRELRVIRVTKMQDPNEELLHWAQVMELTKTYYSAAAGGSPTALTEAGCPSGSPDGGTQWDDIAAEAFFTLSVSPSSKRQFLDRIERGPHDDILLDTLASFLLQQKTIGVQKVIGITFSDQILSGAARDAITREGNAESSNIRRIRVLRFVFRKLRQGGLLFLEDEAADRHVLLSFEASLKPALLELLQGHAGGCSVAEIADAVLTKERFKCIPLQWVETGLERLLASQLVIQSKETHRFRMK